MTKASGGPPFDITFAQLVWETAQTYLLEAPETPVPLWISEESGVYGVATLRHRLARAEQELARIVRMSALDFLDETRAQQETTLQRIQNNAEDQSRRRERYLALRSEVERWVPPTPDHQALRHLMLQQLKEAIQDTMDCTPIVTLNVDVATRIHKEAIHKAREEVRNIQHRLNGARERLRWRNSWVAALHASVPQPEEDK